MHLQDLTCPGLDADANVDECRVRQLARSLGYGESRYAVSSPTPGQARHPCLELMRHPVLRMHQEVLVAHEHPSYWNLSAALPSRDGPVIFGDMLRCYARTDATTT